MTVERMVVIFPPPSSPPSSGNARERELQHWDRLEERGSQLDLLPFRELKSVWLKQLTWQVLLLETPQQGFGWFTWHACLAVGIPGTSLLCSFVWHKQTNKPSLRLSISPKKGYVVKFSTVATEWLRVHRSWGNGFGNIWREFVYLQGVHFKTYFALWRFQVPSRFVQVTRYPAIR